MFSTTPATLKASKWALEAFQVLWREGGSFQEAHESDDNETYHLLKHKMDWEEDQEPFLVREDYNKIYVYLSSPEFNSRKKGARGLVVWGQPGVGELPLPAESLP
jgi:hypothetical protein